MEKKGDPKAKGAPVGGRGRPFVHGDRGRTLKVQGLGRGAAAGAVRGVGAVRAAPCSPHFSSPVAAADDVWLGARVTAVPRTARRARPPPRASLGVQLLPLAPSHAEPPALSPPHLPAQNRRRASSRGGLGVTAAARGGEKAGGSCPQGRGAVGREGGLGSPALGHQQVLPCSGRGSLVLGSQGCPAGEGRWWGGGSSAPPKTLPSPQRTTKAWSPGCSASPSPGSFLRGLPHLPLAPLPFAPSRKH